MGSAHLWKIFVCKCAVIVNVTMSCNCAQMNVEEEYERLMAALAKQHAEVESKQRDLYAADPLLDTSAAVAAELDRLKVQIYCSSELYVLYLLADTDSHSLDTLSAH